MQGILLYGRILRVQSNQDGTRRHGKNNLHNTLGTFCYKVMPFGLKNAGATYQRAMVALLHDMIHQEIEVYVDDMIAKSNTEEEHLSRGNNKKMVPSEVAIFLSRGKIVVLFSG